MFGQIVLCAADLITPAFRATLPACLPSLGAGDWEGQVQQLERHWTHTHTLTALATFFPLHSFKFRPKQSLKILSSDTTKRFGASSTKEREREGEGRGSLRCCSEFLTNASLCTARHALEESMNGDFLETNIYLKYEYSVNPLWFTSFMGHKRHFAECQSCSSSQCH